MEKMRHKFVVTWNGETERSVWGSQVYRHVSTVRGIDRADAIDRFSKRHPGADVVDCEVEAAFIARSEPGMRSDVAAIKRSIYRMEARALEPDRRSAVALAAVLYAIGLTLTTFALRAMGA